LHSIRKNTRRMAGLMEEVLLIGSLEAGKTECKPGRLALGPFLGKLVAEVQAATHRRCPIHWTLSGAPGPVWADERLLRPILTNLLTNAVKYSEAGQPVGLAVECAGPELVCAIRDRGIGIGPADQEWLFSAFHRGQNVGERPGTGLGLVIVKRCVELHGGTIALQSQLGQGTTVTVRLPLVAPGLGGPALSQEATAQ
jgi:signal transduction histidine kinase